MPILVKHCILTFTLVVFAALTSANADNSGYTIDSVRFSIGDDPSWNQPLLDDSSWKLLTKVNDPENLPSPQVIPSGIFWLRVNITIAEEADPLASQMLVTQLFGSSEVYWDGQLIGQYGVVAATKEQERPGLLFKWSHIPDHLYTPGQHIIAYRISSHYDKPAYVPLVPEFFIIQDTQAIQRVIDEVLPQRFLLGTITIIGLFYFLLYALYDRKIPYLLFGFVCAGISGLEFVQGSSIRNIFSFTYDQASDLMRLVLFLIAFVSLLLPWFLATQFDFARRKRWVGTIAVLIILALAFGRDDGSRSVLTGLIGVTSGVIISISALIKRQRGSTAVTVGISLLLGSLLFHSGMYSNFGFFTFVFCLLISLTQYMRIQRDDHQRALLKEAKLETTKARLESELLKSSIQPHFLMNTLNALVDWVEENPKKGVKLILEIGRHFDMLIAISGKTTIPTKLEIELCQSFLSIMSYRKDLQYRLHASSISESDTISPCIFHTLAENGVTHNHYETTEVIYTLTCQTTAKRKRYRFETPRGTPQKTTRSERLSQGTGLKYIESRLEESYPNAWTLRQESSEHSWVTTIEIAATPRHPQP